jgi:hypothetical protein
VEKFGEKWTDACQYRDQRAYKLKDWVVNEAWCLSVTQYWDNAKTVD